jgi:hypothetical protein
MSAADPVDFEEMAAEQNFCPETQRLLVGKSLKLAFRQKGAQLLARDVSTGNFCPIIPLKFRKTILTIFTMSLTPRGLLVPPVVLLYLGLQWQGLSNDVTAWARGCLACQRGKIQRHTRMVPQPIPSPQRRFSHIHVDLVGPLQYSNNFNYIFTIIDRTSK